MSFSDDNDDDDGELLMDLVLFHVHAVDIG